MKSRHLSNAAVLAVILFFSACNSNSNNTAVFKVLKENLESSTKAIQMNSQLNLHSLQEKTTEPETKRRADLWFPKATQITKLSTDVFNYIDNLKKIKEINSEKAKELFIYLINYKENVLSIDSSIRIEFEKNIFSFLNSSDTIEKNGNVYNTFFKGTSPIQTLAILTKFQNDVTLTENKLTTFCNLQIGQLDGPGYYDSFSAIVALNSSYVKGGEAIEITAGMGSFSIQERPVITINRKNVPLREDGAAVYSFKASNKPGKHFVPARIDYYDQNGNKQYLTKALEYTVAKECDQ